MPITQPEHSVRIPDDPDIADTMRIMAHGWADAHYSPENGIDHTYINQQVTKKLSPVSEAKWRQRAIDTVCSPNEFFFRIACSPKGLIIAALSAKRKNDLVLFDSCYVLPEWRNGGRNGPAQLLMNAAIAWTGEYRADVLIATYNRRSTAFCRRNGFTEQGYTTQLGIIPVQQWIRPPLS